MTRLFLAVLVACSMLNGDPALGRNPQLDGDSRTPWGSLGVIDVHAHCGSFHGFDLSSQTLLEQIEKFGVSLALVSNIDGAELPGTTANLSEERCNDATAELVRKHDNRLRGLVWTRPEDGSASNCERFLKMKLKSRRPVFVGMKFHPEMNHFNADDKRAEPYLELCRKYSIAAVFHCGADGSASSPDRIYAAARKFPTVPVVLYHMGFGGDPSSSISAVKSARRKNDANLFLETAQVPADGVLEAIKQVGSDRVLFGTDATYFGKTHYANYVPVMYALRVGLKRADFDRVVRQNALKIFPLE